VATTCGSGRSTQAGTVRAVETIAELNAAAADAAQTALLACCASRRWAAVILAARPYQDLAHLLGVSDATLAALDWADVEEALAGHPRIGERMQGAGQEAEWSRREQSAAATGDGGLRAALTAGNVEYEQRFGHVFLIRATGRGATEILTELHQRLGNDEPTEREVVRAELAGIVHLRLERLLDH
jgi:2-oxo-4-hydroxy-4-carboxy-5-ureidoimidazoline decarboxylase